MEKPPLIIFDVNETLLDLSSLKESINSAFAEERAADIWFAELLHYSMVETVRDRYNDFSKIAEAVLSMNANKFGLSFSAKDIKNILKPISKLSPYEDVIPALSGLRSKNMELVAFSNGKTQVLEEQLKFAGIDHFFSGKISVDRCQKYKPHPVAYEYVLQELNTPASATLMVAAHGWDIAGAQHVGMRTAFVERPGKTPYPLASPPELIIKNLTGLVEVFN